MSGTDSKEFSGEFTCPYSAGAEFDRALSRAETLAQSGDSEGALELLWHLEKKYMRAARLFDVIGDVLLRRGQVEAGVRYKTLNEILRGTFKIALEESGSRGLVPFAAMGSVQPPPATAAESAPSSPLPETSSAAPRSSEPPEESAEYIPMTAAMANEFMRQGHFDKALGIYSVLVGKAPEDESLISARERARKKKNEKKVVTMLQRWLNNIERLKGERDARL
jgi:hypothetical protein